jgi:hypothetical protein
MKVNGSGGIASQTPSRGARAPAAPGFSTSVQSARPGVSAGPTAGVAGLSSVDALLALQTVDDPLERRRRAMGRAGRILDTLDEVKLAMLEGGNGSAAALMRLRQAVREQREGTNETALEGVLDEIETRAAVELAKAENRALAA